MNINLQHKNALVGGSSKGIGKAIAKELANLGANVTLMARTESLLKEVLESLDRSKGQVHSYIVADFSDSKKLKEKIEKITENKTIHILINNTGGPSPGTIVKAQVDEFTNAFHNHIVCNQILSQAVIPKMKAAKYGRIINIISTSVKQPIPNLGVSNTIRGAVANWGKTMSNELAIFGITVNNVLPGSTKTDRLFATIHKQAEQMGRSKEQMEAQFLQNIPAKRFGEVQEIADAVAFLASPSASYITGINLPVDGGKTKNL